MKHIIPQEEADNQNYYSRIAHAIKLGANGVNTKELTISTHVRNGVIEGMPMFVLKHVQAGGLESSKPFDKLLNAVNAYNNIDL